MPTEPPTAQAVIDALRLMATGQPYDGELGRLTRILIDHAPDSEGRSTDGVDLLMSLLRDGTLVAKVTDAQEGTA